MRLVYICQSHLTPNTNVHRSRACQEVAIGEGQGEERCTQTCPPHETAEKHSAYVLREAPDILAAPLLWPEQLHLGRGVPTAEIPRPSKQPTRLKLRNADRNHAGLCRVREV
jgi:hypothetical protein